MPKKLLLYLAYWWIDFYFLFIDKETKRIITIDVERYSKWNNFNDTSITVKLNKCMRIQPFRSQFYYRLSGSQKKATRIISKISRFFLRNCEGVEIDGKIGPGLMISHNHSVIHPAVAGTNLRVGPGVVIGQNKGIYPTIGNNVYIAANSVIIGNITIGDNVIIGAGSVVVKDIPNNKIVVGNPARILRDLIESDKKELQ